MGTLDYMKRLKVVVCIPSMGMWYERFGISLINMLTYCQTHRIGEFKSQEIRVASSRGSILPNLRLSGIQQAQEEKAQYLCFIDSDQTFPQNTLHRLIHWNKDVVAANIATKTIPAQPTARLKGPDSSKWIPVYTPEGDVGLQRVDRVGTGLMLMKTSVFEKIGYKMMEMRWRDEIEKYGGEDWPICEALEQHGFEIFVDHGLSNHVGHVGEFIYTHDVVGELRNVGPANAQAA